MIQVTKKQNEYLLKLATGPKTTNEIRMEIMVKMATAGKMINKLKDAGLVESTRRHDSRGNVLNHRLVTPYKEMVKNGLIITNKTTGTPIREEEILYAAILRNGGLTGRRLTDQFIKVFPRRAKKTIIKHIVTKARLGGLCR